MAYRFRFGLVVLGGVRGGTMRPLRELWAGHEEEDDEEEGFDQIGRSIWAFYYYSINIGATNFALIFLIRL